jgi:hypothetical protein
MLDTTYYTLRMPVSALETIYENARRFSFSTRTRFPVHVGTGFAKTRRTRIFCRRCLSWSPHCICCAQTRKSHLQIS